MDIENSEMEIGGEVGVPKTTGTYLTDTSTFSIFRDNLNESIVQDEHPTPS